MFYLLFFCIHLIKSTPVEGENFTSPINQLEPLANYTDFSCQKLEISFDPTVQAICNNKKQVSFNLTDLGYFGAEIYSELIIENYTVAEIDIDDYVLQIGDSVYFRRNSTVKFVNFWNFSLIQTFLNMHQNVKVTPWVSLQWNHFHKQSQNICAWDQDSFYDNFKDNKLFIRDMLLETMKDSNWNKLCMNGDGWLIYHEKQDEKIVEEVEVHEIALLYALIITILIIILVVLLLFLIAFFRYKRGMTKKRPVENEFCLSMSSSSSSNSSSGSGSKLNILINSYP